MKYLVMECHPAYAVVLDEEGRFLKVANFRYEVGQSLEEVVEYRKKTLQWGRWLAPVAAAACLVLVLLGGFRYFYMTPYGAVQLAVNPKVELTVNRMNRVIAERGLNEDGTALLEGYDASGKTVEEAAAELARRAVEMGYLSAGETVYVDAQSAHGEWNAQIKGRVILALDEKLDDSIFVAGMEDMKDVPHDTGAPSTTDDDDDDDDDPDDDDDDDDPDDDDD